MGFEKKSPWLIHYDGSSCNALRKIFPKDFHNLIVLRLSAVKNYKCVIFRKHKATLTEKSVCSVAVRNRIAPKLIAVAHHIINIAVRYGVNLLSCCLFNPNFRNNLSAVFPFAAVNIGQEKFCKVLTFHIKTPTARIVAFAVTFPKRLFNSERLKNTRIEIINNTHTRNLSDNGRKHCGIFTYIIKLGIRRKKKRSIEEVLNPIRTTFFVKHGNKLIRMHCKKHPDGNHSVKRALTH